MTKNWSYPLIHLQSVLTRLRFPSHPTCHQQLQPAFRVKLLRSELEDRHFKCQSTAE